MPIKGKNIIIGISGGIAAYKTAFLIRLFRKKGANVKVVITKSGLEFITRVTLETLSQNKVYCGVFDPENDYTSEHVSLTDWGDIFITAPATANIIGKYANGIADDALSTSLLAFDKQKFFAPAMNYKMYNNSSVQKNIEVLKNEGVIIIEPKEGFLACGYEGKGRMEEPENIFKHIENHLKKKRSFEGKKVLVTAGPTHEDIDPVRYIGNRSSGLMGFKIAEEFADRGAKVTLITGPVRLSADNTDIKRINVISANQMHKECLKEFPEKDIVIMAAAVSDYTIANRETKKIKKQDSSLNIELKPTNDILADMGKIKQNKQILVGFALETDNELNNAKEKLKKKNLDMIVLNSLNDKDTCFGTETNKISILDNNKQIIRFDLKSKIEVAKDIADHIYKLTK